MPACRLCLQSSDVMSTFPGGGGKCATPLACQQGCSMLKTAGSFALNSFCVTSTERLHRVTLRILSMSSKTNWCSSVVAWEGVTALPTWSGPGRPGAPEVLSTFELHATPFPHAREQCPCRCSIRSFCGCCAALLIASGSIKQSGFLKGMA